MVIAAEDGWDFAPQVWIKALKRFISTSEEQQFVMFFGPDVRSSRWITEHQFSPSVRRQTATVGTEWLKSCRDIWHLKTRQTPYQSGGGKKKPNLWKKFCSSNHKPENTLKDAENNEQFSYKMIDSDKTTQCVLFYQI